MRPASTSRCTPSAPPSPLSISCCRLRSIPARVSAEEVACAARVAPRVRRLGTSRALPRYHAMRSPCARSLPVQLRCARRHAARTPVCDRPPSPATCPRVHAKPDAAGLSTCPPRVHVSTCHRLMIDRYVPQRTHAALFDGTLFLMGLYDWGGARGRGASGARRAARGVRSAGRRARGARRGVTQRA